MSPTLCLFLKFWAHLVAAVKENLFSTYHIVEPTPKVGNVDVLVLHTTERKVRGSEGNI
jgi:hypothetical protein